MIYVMLSVLAFTMVAGLSQPDHNQSLENRFIQAAKVGDTKQVLLFLEEGIDVNASNKDGWTALHEAAGYCHTDTVKTLLSWRAEVNKVVEEQSPLTGAAINGCLEVARLLLDAGAEVNVKANGGMQPLIWAVKTGRTSTVQLLLERGANAAVRGYKGETALIAAVSWLQSNAEIVQLLIKHKCPINQDDHNGWTALMHAVNTSRKFNDIERIRLLIIAGADVNKISKDKKTALKLAQASKNDSLVKLLLQYGAR